MTDWKKALSAVESGSLSLDTELSSPRQQPSPSAFDLQDVPANNTGGQRFDLPLFDDELQKRRLDVSLGNAVDKNPQQASELSKLARSSGLPVETVEGQIKEVRKRTMLEEMGTKKIVQQTPTLADFLADPQNANQAHKDIKQLSTIEIVLRAHKRGGLINEEGRGYFATMFDDDESINTYLDGIEQSLSTTHADEGGFANEFLDPAAEIAGQMTNLYKNSADEALLGATAGGMYGTYLSAPTGGAIAPLTATAGAVAGAGVGLTSSAAREAFVIESGHAYKEFLSFKDDEGVGMDKGTAKNAALLVGAINASLEMLGVAVVTKPWVEAAKKMTRKQVMLSLKNPTMRRAITNFAKNYIVSGAGEVAVEVTQEIVTMAVGELAKKGSDAEFESMPLDEALSRAGEVAEKVTKGMMVLGLGGAGVNLTQDVKAARKGRTEAKKLTDVSKQVNASELKKNNPDAFKELMQRIGKETDSETVYLDADETKLLFQSSNIDPELFEIPAVQKMLGEMDQAIEEGRNIEVPIEEYAQDIMGTALEDLLLPYAKLSHDAMSMSEQQNKTVNEEVDRLAALNAEEFESQQVVYNDILGQRLGLGILRETAEKEALWYEATLRVLAKRVGKTPEEIWEKRKLRIQNEVDPHTARRIQAITGLDMLLNRLREGDVPKQKDIYGESLFQFIQSKGGISQKDEGGEVSGTDIDYGVIGKNRLVRPQGMSLDGMAELAAGEGFIPVDEHGKWNIQDLINAIGEEADGNPQYLDGNLNAEKQTAQQDLFSLEEALGQAGIDIQQTDNASIIEQFFSGTEGVVFQARTEGYQGNELSEASEWVRAVDKGLDMSEDARMARAHEQGYDIERKLYHGTSDDIASFDPEMLQQRDSGFIGLGVYLTSSPRIADFYANTAARYKANEDGGYSNSNILQLLAITEKTKTYNLADKGDMGVEAFNDRSFPKRLTDDLKKQGYDSAQVLDASDGIVEVVIFDPSNVRSVYAAFDPDYTESANLLAQAGVESIDHTMGGRIEYRATAKGLTDVYFDGEFFGRWNDWVTARDEVLNHPAMRKELFTDKGDNFIAWFGESKVVDESGKPLIVYHGSPFEFSEFDPEKLGEGHDQEGAGFYFTNNETEASGYIDGSQRHTSKTNSKGGVIAAYIKIENPVPLTGKVKRSEISKLVLSANGFKSKAKMLAAFEENMDLFWESPLSNWDESPRTAFEQQVAAIADGAENPHDAFQQAWFDVFGADNASYMKAMIELGYDGVVLKNEEAHAGNDHYIVFDPASIKSVDNSGEFSRDTANIFNQSWYRSALKDTVAGIDKIADKKGFIQPKQAKSWLASQQKKGAFKQEEIEWVGLNEWLDIQEGKVSVEDIQAFVDANGVQVEEVVLGFDQSVDDAVSDWYGNSDAGVRQEGASFIASYGGGDIQESFDTEDAAWEVLYKQARSDIDEYSGSVPKETKYSEYQLEGGENYRELLLTLPARSESLEQQAQATFGASLEELSEDEKAELAQTTETGKQEIFTSSHWDESNVLAHIRMNDRVDSEGNKVLFIEEMQSDWASDGRKNGFAVAARDTDGWSAELQPSGRYSVIDENGLWMSNYSASSPEDAVSLAAESRPDNRVSNAPFVKETKSYLALATKRIIAYAAENSYDKVAIINGEQSAERYDLSKQVDSIRWNPDNDLLVADKNGEEVISQSVPENELADYIGKDAAAKLIESEARYDDGSYLLSGDDLSVGGEGMKAFYDQIVPQVLKSVLKKTGGNKLEPVVMGDLSQTGFSITEQMKENVSNGLPLFQKDKGPRGYFNPETDTITLTPDADMSTFIHESAHFFFEIMRDLAKDDSGIAADLEAVDKWARSQGAVTDREIHEHFASGYEARLFEGKSPSTALQSLYFTFSKWIQNVYDSADDIFRANGMEGSKLSDEVREVYDRLIATDEEIEAARSQQNYGPMPMEQIGMSPEEAVAYQVMVNDAGDEARSNLENQVMRQMQRATKDWWKKGVAKRVQGVRAELDEQPEYRARDFLSGDRIPEGVTAVKLDGKYITDVYGKAVARKLNRMTSKDGVHPALVAPMFGYADSADIVEALMNTMTKAERKKYEQSQAQTMMREEHGDMLLDGSVAEEAQRAVHNEKQAELLLEEMKFLNRRAGNQQTPRQHFKAAAERSISAMPINQIRPDKYRRNEAKARSQAIKFAAKGEYKKAALEQHKALRQFYLAKVSADAVEESNAGYKYAKSLLSGSKYKTIQKAGDHYIGQIKAILEQVELRKVSNKQLTRRQSMKAWHKATLDAAGIGNPELVSDLLEDAEKPIREQEMRDDTQTLGANFYVVDDLINSQKAKNYRELTVDEFSAVVQAMKHVEHMAKLKTKLLTDKDKREINERIADLIAEIEEHSMGVKKNDTFGSIKTNKEVRGEKWRQYFDTSRTPTSLIRMLGGFKEGSDAWRILGQPLQDASALETDQLNIANMEIERIFGDHYSETELKLMNIKRYNRSVGKLFSKHDALSILLNWGSETNRLRVIDGFRIDEATAVSLMDSYLDERDYKFVNELVDFVGGFKKAAFELHEDMYGFTPEEVVPIPFASKYGQQKGWYWPIKYNTLKSSRAEQNSLTSIEQFDSRLSATKKLGSTESRAKRVFMEIETDMMTVLMGHTADVIHKTTHQRALYDIGRVLSDNKVKQSIQDAHGDHVYKQITSMVRNVKEGAEQARNFNDWIFQHARNNVTIAMLGASVTTSSIQMFGATNSFVKARFLGASLSKGYVKYGKNMPETIKVIREKSLYMKNREQVMSVAIARIKNKLRKRGRLDKIKEMSMIPIMKVQFLTVDAPLWIAIYDHNIENGISEKDSIDRADQAVRDAQGGGDIVDTAEGMQGGAAMRLFTNFLSYMVSTYTLQSEAFHRLKVGEDNFFDFAVNSFVLMLMPSMVMAVFRDWIAGEDDDETLWKRFIKETGSFWLSTNVISAQFSGIASGFDYSGPQGTAIVGKVGQLSKQAVQGEADEALFKAMIWVGGLTLGLPAAQANRSLFGAIDAIEKDKPPSKFVKQAFFGKER